MSITPKQNSELKKKIRALRMAEREVYPDESDEKAQEEADQRVLEVWDFINALTAEDIVDPRIGFVYEDKETRMAWRRFILVRDYSTKRGKYAATECHRDGKLMTYGATRYYLGTTLDKRFTKLEKKA